MADRQLIVPQRLLRRIVEHCLEEKPYEACGILTGKNGRVLQAYATSNARRSPVAYEVERRQQMEVLKRMAECGEELVGIYHSHPTSRAYPSSVDIQEAVHYPEAVRMIISLNGRVTVRAFLIDQGRVHPVQIQAREDFDGRWHDCRGWGGGGSSDLLPE